MKLNEWKILIIIGFLSIFSISQIETMADNPPQAFSYQAIIRNAQGQLLIEKPIRTRITIFSPGNGFLLAERKYYTETHSVTTNENGLIMLMIGTGETSDDFATIEWSGIRPRFIRTEIDVENLNAVPNYTIITATQLLSVPYALLSNKADTCLFAENALQAENAAVADRINGVRIYKKGDVYDGDGIVFWVDETGMHGYACLFRDMDPAPGRNDFKWLSKDVSIYGTRAAIGAGHYNSLLMTIANKGDYRFAPAAYDNMPGSYDASLKDWFIPSYYELSLLYQNREYVSNLTGWYWSSTGYVLNSDEKYAYAINFDTGEADSRSWDNAFNVRIIRKF